MAQNKTTLWLTKRRQPVETHILCSSIFNFRQIQFRVKYTATLRTLKREEGQRLCLHVQYSFKLLRLSVHVFFFFFASSDLNRLLF